MITGLALAGAFMLGVLAGRSFAKASQTVEGARAATYDRHVEQALTVAGDVEPATARRVADELAARRGAVR